MQYSDGSLTFCFFRVGLRMSTAARRRLMRDFKRLQEDPPAGVSGAPTDNNILLWNAVIFGPADTPFEDGTFKLTIEFTGIVSISNWMIFEFFFKRNIQINRLS